MGLSFRINPSAANLPNLMDLCADALVSQNPPLAFDSVTEIAKIKSDRVALIEGSDRYQTLKLFDALEKLPPIEGVRTQRLLTLLIDTDFSDDAIGRALEKCSSKSGEHPYEQANEFGYISDSVEIVSTHKSDNIALDSKRADRDGIEAIAEVCANFRCILDSNVRNAVVGDCCKILDLRLYFDFSEEAV